MNYDLSNFTNISDPGAFASASNQLSGGLMFTGIIFVLMIGIAIIYYKESRNLPGSILAGSSASTIVALIFYLSGWIQGPVFFISLSVMLLGIIGSAFNKT